MNLLRFRFRMRFAGNTAALAPCLDNARILLANPEIRSYCTNIKLLIDENKTNYMMLAGRECMSAQTSATRPFFCQFATKIIFVV